MNEIETIIKHNEERKPAKVEEITVHICRSCTDYYGQVAVLSECSYGCGDYFSKDEEIICSEGRHYHKSCFNAMDDNGEVEPFV